MCSGKTFNIKDLLYDINFHFWMFDITRQYKHKVKNKRNLLKEDEIVTYIVIINFDVNYCYKCEET